ncbi:MAG TPA: HAD family phosphatase [Candidatus Paceibacterota bacterium]
MNNIKLICFDLDETLINSGSWKGLGLALGVSVEEDRRLYNEYKSGKITYDEWNDKILEYYLKHEDSNRDEITKILSNYSYIEGAREAVEYLKSKGYKIVLISGSIDILVNMVALDLGIQYSKANNTFIFDDNDKLIGIHSGGNDVLAKASHLESFCEMFGIDIKECACIADGANDIEMFRLTEHGITFSGSPIENEAWKVINSFSDLKNIF